MKLLLYRTIKKDVIKKDVRVVGAVCRCAGATCVRLGGVALCRPTKSSIDAPLQLVFGWCLLRVVLDRSIHGER